MDQQDNYLHKKFKKQLSIEPRTNQAQCNNINNNNNNSVSNNNNAKDVGLLQQQDGFGGGGGGCSGGVPTTKSTNSLTVLSYVKKSSISSPPLPSSSSFSSNSSSSSSSSSLSSPPSSTTICTNGVENANNNVVNVDQIDVDDGNHPQDISLKSLSLQESSAAAVTSSTAVAATNSTTSASSSGGKYVCTYCNLACSKPSVLQKHIRAHTNERPYPCVSCGFSFKTRSNLYKHCRSRTHANRLLGNYGTRPSSGTAGGANQERDSSPPTITASTNDSVSPERNQFKEDTLVEQQQQQHLQQPQKQQQQFNQMKSKPYKPRFHTRDNGENVENEVTMPAANSEMIMHINEIIDKNNSIVNSEFARRRPSDEDVLSAAEPLNLTKSRKRCLSEVSEPSTQKSLIKELLLKNLYADTNMRCPHCKMIFQTVTELELHKMRNCKGIIKSGPRYSRSSSVNVASILTQNKNAFDNIPAVFPLKSPGPFLGKTRLVESDKSKSFSFEEGIETIRYSSFSYDSRTKRPPVKMFGGEVKITQTSGETKSFKIDGKEHGEDDDYPDYKMSENRVVKSTLQSGGTVMQSKVVVGGYVKQQQQHQQQETTSVRIDSPAECVTTVEHHHRNQRTDKDPPDRIIVRDLSNGTTKYPNILDFSQNAVKLLAPNLRQLNLSIPLSSSSSSSPSRSIITSTTPTPNHLLTICESPQTTTITSTPLGLRKEVVASTPHHQQQHQNGNILNPLNLLVNGKVVRYVPGMPGPVVAEPPIKLEKPAPPPPPIITITTDTLPPSPSQQKISPLLKLQPSSSSSPEKKKFARPNSLALKPSMSSLKQHHGLTPTMFNQILISPDTPRGAKKYNEHFLHGNYFSYLGLKSSTKPVYCTLNKTQPFYVPHFKKLSMYSEWRQQDNKADKMYSAAYDSRQRNQKYTTAGKDIADYIVHSSYKFSVSENSGDDKEDEYGKSNSIFGGYESNEDYTYIRGRGRGRYVCDQCGIRCKKPSMLKKHIRTHSNDRPYTCRHCNFSFKTKGNLTKHMKSKAHTKNYAASSSSSSTAAALHAGYQPSSDSDTDDSGMDSSDESSTRQEEHEAAYGLLSLSQKSPNSSSPSQSNHHHNYNNHSDHFMNADQLVHVSKINYAKNVIMNQQRSNLGTLGIINSTVTVTATANICSTTATSATSSNTHPLSSAGSCEGTEYTQYLGKSNPNRPLTYPYNTASSSVGMPMSIEPPVLPPIPPLNDDSPQRLEVVEEESRRSPEKQPKNIINFNVIKRYSPQQSASPIFRAGGQSLMLQDEEMVDEKDRKRKLEPPSPQTVAAFKLHKNIKDGEVENEEVLVIDLSRRQNGVFPSSNLQTKERPPRTPTPPTPTHHHQHHQQQLPLQLVGNQHILQQQQQQALPVFRNNGLLMEHRVNYYYQDRPPVINAAQVENAVSVATRKMYYDNSAMETLADVATKQEKLEKNSMAKNVASEFLKLATQNEQNANGGGPSTATSLSGAVGSPCGSAVASCSSNAGGGSGGSVGNSDDKAFLANSDLVKSSEENKSCTICSKNFSKPSQLRLHMNIHYLERPFRCETCSVSFRTKGHLQKHERSAMHCNKLSSSPATSSSEPRPFKCADCNIAFRIHGHLAKHLRSKMHIMKLECLAKIPFGLYAELERSNSLLTEINTADGDQCLDSLKLLAKRVFLNDPSKQSHFEDDKSEGMETTDTES